MSSSSDRPRSALIVGGGIVGLATAYQLSLASPGTQITLLEKENEVGRHQTGNNSGVLHAGLYYAPGSLKARLAVEGIRQMVRFCRESSIAHEICGKLVIATDEAETARLKELLTRGQKNGLQNLRWLEGTEIRHREPYAGGVAAIHVPEEGIVDYRAVCRRLVETLSQKGAKIQTCTQVLKLERKGKEWIAHSKVSPPDAPATFQAEALINCAGLYSDRVARSSGETPTAKIVPFRGEYFMLRKERANLVRNLIYPVPDPAFPFLGVHFTRMIHGGVEAGPNAVLALAREGYRKIDFNLRDVAESVTYPGLWKFFQRYPSMVWSELRRSLSRELFCRSLQKLVPTIQTEDLEPGGSGVRAQAMLADGTLVQDFHLHRGPSAIHVLNAPSPAATASFAIGQEIVNRLLDRQSS